jgi:hypothetical protein
MNTPSLPKTLELESINGIGPSRAKLLDAIGIRRYGHLAQLKAGELAHHFRGVTPAAAQKWIDEASQCEPRRDVASRGLKSSLSPSRPQRPSPGMARVDLVGSTPRTSGPRVGSPVATSTASTVASPAKAQAVSTVPARLHRTFTIDVQTNTKSGEIIGATVTDNASGDALTTPLDAGDILAFIKERAIAEAAPSAAEARRDARATEPAKLVSCLHTSSIADLILGAEHGYGVTVVLPPGHGEADIWVTRFPLSGEPPLLAGSGTCQLSPTRSTSTTIECARISCSNIPSRLEIVAELRVSRAALNQHAGVSLAAALVPDPSVVLNTDGDSEAARFQYWRNRSIRSRSKG